MTESSQLSVEEIRTHWSKYVQSPAQLGFSRMAKFPPESTPRLVDVLDVGEEERILEVGCGLGILSGRLLESNRPARIVGCDLEPDLLQSNLPEPLRPGRRPERVRADGLSLPFEEGTFDRVITHTLVNLLDRDETARFHDETRRVLVENGTINHMDGLTGDRWNPWELVDPEEEQKRRDQFHELLREVHDDLETGFTRTVRDLSQKLERYDFENIRVDSYSTAFRINNPHWNEPQQKLLLELWQRADRDRVERLRNLLQATGRMNPDRGDLLRNCISDAQQQALRRRKAFSENRELGWKSSTTLVFSATTS